MANHSSRDLLAVCIVLVLFLGIGGFTSLEQQLRNSSAGCNKVTTVTSMSANSKARSLPGNMSSIGTTNLSVALDSVFVKPRRILLYDRILHTGLGDRFTVLLCVAAMGRAVGADVVTYWYSRPPDGSGGVFRYYPIDDVMREVAWPSNLKVISQAEFAKQYPPEASTSGGLVTKILYNQPGQVISMLAYDGIYTIARRTMEIDNQFGEVTQEKFIEAYRQVGAEFGIQSSYEKYLKWLPPKFVGLHVRGADRFESNLDSYKTKQILDRISDELVIVVISDDTRLVKLLLQHSPQLQVLHRPNVFSSSLQRVELDILDLIVLSRASAIIQHASEAWSAYSVTAALAKGIPLINTYIHPSRPDTKSIGLLSEFLKVGTIPDELMTANFPADIERFMKHLDTLKTTRP